MRRGRFTLAGSDVKAIFEPVIDEILKLVSAQITASNYCVKAVLMVGGFGQNAYLRDRIRAQVAPMGVEVMQSPNGYLQDLMRSSTMLTYSCSWTAVVRGALMKGLASTSPSFATVGIQGRCARKHYGLHARKPFDEALHDQNRRLVCPMGRFDGGWI